MPGSDPRSDAGPGHERRSASVARRVAVPVLTFAVLLPYVFTFLSLWSRTGDQLDHARSEQAGVAALRPMVTLIAATTDAQTTAVNGDRPDETPVRKAMTAVDAADDAVGSTLGTDRRWADLRSRLDQALSNPARGTAAYTAWSQVVDLELALVGTIGDASGLRTDPGVDAHYLVDATLVRLPEMLVSAARISDLTLLLEQRKAPVEPDTLAVAVGQADLRRSASTLDDGLRKGFRASVSRRLGPGLLSELDRLRDAVTELSPPLPAVGSAPVPRPAAATQTARQQLRIAAIETETAALDELDALVEVRAADLTRIRTAAAAATAVGLGAALAVLWFAGPRRRTDRPGDAAAGVGVPADDVPDGTSPAETAGADVVPAGLLEARDLLEARQLLRVGRAVAARHEEASPPDGEDP